MVELINKKNQIIECKLEQVPEFLKHGYDVHIASDDDRKQIEAMKKPVKPEKKFSRVSDKD
jgi:hypothetical protein